MTMAGADEIPTLKLEKIAFGYDGQPTLFKDFSFEMPKEEFVWLKSAPGAGKSSLLKIFVGLLSPSQGRYMVNDVNVLDLSFKEFLPYRFAFGYSFDTFGLLANRTIRDNLLLPLLFHQLCSEKIARERVEFWMKRFHLDVCAEQRPFAVTGSQRKSTVLLRSLIHFPQIVFLDDPMAGLKEDGRAAFADLVEDNQKNHGLRQVVFCAERELPLKGVTPHQVFFGDRKLEAA